MYTPRALLSASPAVQACLHSRSYVHAVRPARRSHLLCQAGRTTGGQSTQSRPREEHGSEDFWEKHQVQQKAQAAGRQASERVKKTYQSVEGGVRKAARSVNSRFDLKGKAQQTRDRVLEKLEDVDDKFQIRRKARTTLADAQRQLPQWRRQYSAFSKTLPGKVLWFAFLIWGFRTGFFFKLLNLASLLFLLAPFVILPFAQTIVKRQAAAQAQQRAQQQAQQQQAAQNPFSRFGAFGNSQQQQQKQSNTNTKQSRYAQQDGPVIDAEWTTIDEGDQ